MGVFFLITYSRDMFLDGRVLSAPMIMEKISGGRAHISGRFTLEEASEAAITLKHSYPVRVRLIAVRELTQDLWLGHRDTERK